MATNLKIEIFNDQYHKTEISRKVFRVLKYFSMNKSITDNNNISV